MADCKTNRKLAKMVTALAAALIGVVWTLTMIKFCPVLLFLMKFKCLPNLQF